MKIRIKELREQKKISQKKLCDDLGYNPTTYNNYELLKNEPNIETLVKLADYYNVSIDYLVGRDTSNDVGYLNEMETYLMKMFRELNSQSQAKVVGYIEAELSK